MTTLADLDIDIAVRERALELAIARCEHTGDEPRAIVKWMEIYLRTGETAQATVVPSTT